MLGGGNYIIFSRGRAQVGYLSSRPSLIWTSCHLSLGPCPLSLRSCQLCLLPTGSPVTLFSCLLGLQSTGPPFTWVSFHLNPLSLVLLSPWSPVACLSSLLGLLPSEPTASRRLASLSPGSCHRGLRQLGLLYLASPAAWSSSLLGLLPSEPTVNRASSPSPPVTWPPVIGSSFYLSLFSPGPPATTAFSLYDLL